MRWPFSRPKLKRQRKPIEYFCATCCASEGEEHLVWCRRTGVMERPQPGGES